MAGAVYVTGAFGARVGVYQRGRRYYLRAWHRGKRQPRYKACCTSDFEEAKRQARKLSRTLEDGLVQPTGMTLGRVFGRYLAERTPQKAARTRSEDRRRAELWKAYIGVGSDPKTVTLAVWERFQVDRREGRIDARGRTPRLQGDEERCGGLDASKSPQPLGAGSRVGNPAVRPRVIRADLMWLRTVLRWAKAHGMIESNPCEDWPLPADPNPRRSMATEERLEAILKVARKHGYLWELLSLCAETGRRIGAVRQLRYSDLRLKVGPHGSIRWPAHTDKGRRENVIPMSAHARRAVDHVVTARPGIGDAPLFPHPKDAANPITEHYVRRWLEQAERRAGLEHLPGTLWHSYRRKWATERKHLPSVDVAAAGGWTNPRTLETIYQQPDAEGMYRVVSEPAKMRSMDG